MKERISQLIDFSETIIRTDIRYVARGYFWYFIEYGIAAITGLATSVAFANFMAPESYGVFKYVLTFLPFLGLASLKRLNDSLTISVARGNEGDIKTIAWTKIKYGLLGTLAGIILGGYYFYNHNGTLALLTLIAAFFVPIFNLPYIYSNYLLGKKNFQTLSIINSAVSVVYTIAMVLALWPDSARPDKIPQTSVLAILFTAQNSLLSSVPNKKPQANNSFSKGILLFIKALVRRKIN